MVVAQHLVIPDFLILEMQAQFVFNDSIHGTIEVNSLESAIIDSPEFSRLKDIKQLGKENI